MNEQQKAAFEAAWEDLWSRSGADYKHLAMLTWQMAHMIGWDDCRLAMFKVTENWAARHFPGGFQPGRNTDDAAIMPELNQHASAGAAVVLEDGDRRDAERYRWLRIEATDIESGPFVWAFDDNSPSDLDEAIDAAMARGVKR